MAVRIVTDSTAGLSPAFVREQEVSVLPLYLRFEDEVFVENDLDLDRFYAKMAASPTIPGTSRPTYQVVYDTFEALLKAGHEVIGIFVSSGLTGPYNTSCMVMEELKGKYPAAKVELIDSRVACMALGYPVEQAAIAAKKGEPFAKIIADTRELLVNAHIIFAPKTLENLKKGGRIGGAAALIGSLFEIKPLLGVERGTVQVLKKCRGTKSAAEAMLKLLNREAKDFGLRHVIVHYSYTRDLGKQLWQMLYDHMGLETRMEDITPVIAAHVGAGAFGLAYFTERKTAKDRE